MLYPPEPSLPLEAPQFEPRPKDQHGVLRQIRVDAMMPLLRALEAPPLRGVLGGIALALATASASAPDGPAQVAEAALAWVDRESAVGAGAPADRAFW